MYKGECHESFQCIPYDPSKIDLAAFPSSSATVKEVQSPLKVTCSECRSKNVEFHPLVIPKKLAEAFVYTPPPEKPKTKSKVVQHARIITSEEVRAEVKLVEEKKAAKEEKQRLKEVSKVEVPTPKRMVKKIDANKFF